MFEKIVLASASPRRRELLTQAGFAHDIIAANIDEKRRQGERPENYVQRNSKEKALAVCNTQPLAVAKALVLAADTIVVAYDNEVLEKPRDANDARRMLEKLSARTHRVMTGFAICNGTTGEIIDCRTVQTQVLFRQLFADEIDRYIATGEPFDKAGSYGIQGHALTFVESIEGSYTNVVGLPMSHVVLALRQWLPLNNDN